MAAAAQDQEENRTRELNQRDPGFTGIVNLGATCYMNSVLQCLYQTKPLRNYILSPQFREDITFIKNTPRGYVAYYFGQLVCMMWSNKLSAVRTEPLRSMLCRRGDVPMNVMMSDFHEQHDVTEFYNSLIRFLEEDLVRVGQYTPLPEITGPDPSTEISEETNEIRTFAGKWKEHLDERGGTSKVFELFTYMPLQEYRCERCDNTHTVPEVCQKNVVLYLEKEADTFDGYFRNNWHGPRTHVGYTCIKCKGPYQCYQRFYRFPPILVIQIQRAMFDQTLPGTEKDKYYKNYIDIDFPQTFDLSPYVHPAIVDKEKAIYQLYAVIHHRGNSMFVGHYFAYALINGVWREFNDNTVSVSTPEEALTGENARKQIFVLFYELMTNE